MFGLNFISFYISWIVLLIYFEALSTLVLIFSTFFISPLCSNFFFLVLVDYLEYYTLVTLLDLVSLMQILLVFCIGCVLEMQLILVIGLNCIACLDDHLLAKCSL